MLAVAVAYGDKIGQQVSVICLDREISLVFFHHRHQHFRRQSQVTFFELAAQGGWRFYQLSDLIQQSRIEFRLSIYLSYQTLNLGNNRLVAFLLIQKDTFARQYPEIEIGRAS